jgi:hypothetical protein
MKRRGGVTALAVTVRMGAALALAGAACAAPAPTSAPRGADGGTLAASDAGVRSGDVRAAAVAAPAERYYTAYLAEIIGGDRAEARAGYDAVLAEAGRIDRVIAARAALRLAGLAAAEGGRQEALELLARATTLGADDAGVLEAADALRLQLASGSAAERLLRGPALGTAIEGVSSEAASRFAQAEARLGAYQGKRVRRGIEKFDEDLARKAAALDAAVRAYRRVVELGESVAAAAAEFRIGSLHHDWGLTTLTLETPPELEPKYAAPVRADLERRARKSLAAARAAYAASLAQGTGSAGAELWHAAARSGARAVDELGLGR